MTITSASVATEAYEQLAAALRGDLIRPADPGYDEARAVYNAMIDKRPAAIARCRDVADVVTCVRFGRDHGVEIAVRGGGHNAAGLGVWDDALVIDLSLLRSTTVSPENHTVRADAGCTWGDIDHATVAFGMATPSGFLASTGVAGLTLGGGIGYLSRRFGLTVDNLLSADVVLADGTFVTASESSHSDLFWALRGGGGNFGIVTSFTFRCHDIGEHGTVIGGPVLYDIADTAEVMRWYRELLPSLPEELSGLDRAADHPPGSAVPRGAVGPQVLRRRLVLHRTARPGRPGARAGQDVRFAAAGGPAGHAVQRAAERLRWPVPGRAAVVLAGGLLQRDLRRRDRRAPPSTASSCRPVTPPCTCIPSTVPPAACPRARRPSPTGTAAGQGSSSASTRIRPTPASSRRWARDYWQELHPTSAGGAYINFLMDEGQDRVKASYRTNYDRLTQVKKRYDPDNTFHINQNIQPASGSNP